MDGQIIRQSSSYRQGLVLGLTMAEIMLLLIFCLLIAMAAFLRFEYGKLQAAEEQLRNEREENQTAREFVKSVSEQPVLAELIKSGARSSDPSVVNEFWRDLVDSRAIVAEAKRNGVSTSQLKEAVAEVAKLRTKAIDIEAAKRDAEIVDNISTVMPNIRDRSVSFSQIASIVRRGLGGQGNSGHQWPPIINLSEAGGYYFKSGSADLSPEFRNSLGGSIPSRILELIKQYNVDVIEVVGHTDEQPLGIRQSNLDRDLLPVLKGHANVATLSPGDNAGLGLARAVSVVSVLLQSPLLSGYKVLPLSGAQLINNDETLATTGLPIDIRERRRIEIRLRKSTPQIITMSVPTAETAPPAPTAPTRPELPRARPKIVAPSPPSPPATTNSPIFPLIIWPNR